MFTTVAEHPTASKLITHHKCYHVLHRKQVCHAPRSVYTLTHLKIVCSRHNTKEVKHI